MKIIEKNILDFFNEKCTLLSSQLNRLEFKIENDKLMLTLLFILIYPKEKRISLEFTEIEDYSFFVSGECYFYNVERFKLFETDNRFYISLDPYDESEEISDQDNDFILAKKIKLMEH